MSDCAMQKGHRSIFRACLCGCGQIVPPYVNPKTGRVSKYPGYIPGHGYEVWWATMRRLRHGMNHPSAKPLGTTRLQDAGHGLVYRLIKIEPRGRWQYEHRVVMAKKLGRKLRRNEHVHHIDHDTLNNQPKNLALLSHSAHSALHHPARGRWSIKHLACKECGTTRRKHEGHGLCTACFQRQPHVKRYQHVYNTTRR